MIRNALTSLKENLIYAVVFSLVSGLFAGQFIGPETRGVLGTAVVPALFVMIYPMMINIDIREVLNVQRHLRPVGLSLLINFLVTPLVAVGLATVFFGGDPGYAMGLYLIALLPTSGMTAAWSGLAGGDLEAALVAIAVNLIVALFVLPPYLAVLVGGSGGYDPTALYRQLAIVVAIPMVAGALTRNGLIRQFGSDGFKRLKPVFGGMSSVGVMLIVFIATSMQSDSILADPITSIATIVPLVSFYVLVFLVGSLLGRRLLSEAQSITLVYATSMRNLSIALAIVVASEVIPTEAVLPIALAYLLQPPLGALYMHYRRDVVASDRGLVEVLRSASP